MSTDRNANDDNFLGHSTYSRPADSDQRRTFFKQLAIGSIASGAVLGLPIRDAIAEPGADPIGNAKAVRSVAIEDFGGGPSASAKANDAAFSSAFAVSNHVKLMSAGTYDFGTTLILIGKKISSEKGTGATTLHYKGAGAAISVGGSDQTSPELSGFVLSGTPIAAVGLRLCLPDIGCRQGSFRDIHVTGFNGASAIGIELAAATNGGVYYNHFQNVRSYRNGVGWKIWSTDGVKNGNRANANTFVMCSAQWNAGDGWIFDWGVGNTMVGCDREANGGFGINMDHVFDLTIDGGYSENNTRGALNKTPNGSVKMFGGRVIDAIVGVPQAGDIFMLGASGFAVRPDGGIGMGGAAPIGNGINAVSSSDFSLQLSGSSYFGLDHANALIRHHKATRRDSIVRNSVGGVLSLEGVTTEIVEVTLSENITLIHMPKPVDGVSIEILFKQGSGACVVSGWPVSVLLAGGVFKMTIIEGKYDKIRLTYNADFNRWHEDCRSQNM